MMTLLKTKVTLFSIIGVLIAVLATPVPVHAASKCAYYSKYSGGCTKDAISGSRYCKTHTCSASGCNSLTTGGANSRCSSCQKKYLYDSGITSPGCNYSGCSSKKSADSFYCSTHTCHHGSCTSKVISGSRYCSSHTCGKGRSGCYKEVSSANEKCSSCKAGTTKKGTSNNINTTKKTTSNKQSTSKKKKYVMPDCDDYESYEDFMDDWDGCMPDGSDAEDYWENW